MSDDGGDAKAARAAAYTDRLHCASWFLKDALFGAAVCYMFSALDWRFASSMRLHALSAAVLAVFAIAPPDRDWASALAAACTAATLAVDARAMTQLVHLAASPCDSDAWAEVPRPVATACSLAGTTSGVAAGAVAAATGASLLAAARRLALVVPAGRAWSGACWYAAFWAAQAPLVGWPGAGLFACCGASALSATASFCMAKYEGARSWALLPFLCALGAQGGAAAFAARLAAPPAVAWTGAACALAGAGAACGVMWSFRKEYL